jgi:hypothetical protein
MTSRSCCNLHVLVREDQAQAQAGLHTHYRRVADLTCCRCGG